jgi:hypothetical protein
MQERSQLEQRVRKSSWPSASTRETTEIPHGSSAASAQKGGHPCEATGLRSDSADGTRIVPDGQPHGNQNLEQHAKADVHERSPARNRISVRNSSRQAGILEFDLDVAGKVQPEYDLSANVWPRKASSQKSGVLDTVPHTLHDLTLVDPSLL